MADTAENEARQGEEQQDQSQQGSEAQEPDWKAEAEKWKAMSRKHETEAKQNRDAAKRLKEAEDADKSELQKINEKAAESDKAAAHARSELLRLRVAMRKGLTEAQAKRLVGETEEELEADADELLVSFGQQKAAGNGGEPTRPKERLRSGAAPDEEPEETDPRKLAAMVPRL